MAKGKGDYDEEDDGGKSQKDDYRPRLRPRAKS